MIASELWAALARMGVKVTDDGKDIRVRGPRGTITPAIRAEIAAHKAEMVQQFVTVTLILPAGCGLATVPGQWRQLEGGELEATYTRAELEAALWASHPVEAVDQQVPTMAEGVTT